jgi:hypothetical protein
MVSLQLRSDPILFKMTRLMVSLHLKLDLILIQDDQIDGISGEKIIGGIDGALIVAGSQSRQLRLLV